MKKQSIFKLLFGGIDAALLSSCSETPDMYGTPWSDFEIKGSVTDADGEPIEGAMVVTEAFETSDWETVEIPEGIDLYTSATTNNKGEYESIPKEFYTPCRKLKLTCTDPSGKYESASEWATAETEKSKDKDSWYVGKRTFKADFILKKIDK